MDYTVYSSNHSFQIDSNSIEDLDIINLTSDEIHFIENAHCYKCKIISIDTKTKKVLLELDNEKFEFLISSPIDELIKDMGMNITQNSSQKELKAPMPGLILEVLIEVGQQINKDDNLVILEAMKMENILKAEGEGVVKEINMKKGDTVEKHQVLIELE